MVALLFLLRVSLLLLMLMLLRFPVLLLLRVKGIKQKLNVDATNRQTKR